ncbi:MAG: ABC transporter ATP-binding protein [Litorilinea sp.]
MSTLSATNREFSVAGEHVYDRRSPTRWLLSHLLRYKSFLAFFVFAVLIHNVLFAYLPRLIGVAFDEVIQPAPSAQRLLQISLLILGTILIRGVLDILNAFSIETLGQRLERDARDELYVNLLGKSQTFHNRQRVGDIMARASNDVRQLNPMMNPGVSLIVESILSCLAPLIFIALIRAELLITPVIFLLVLIVSVRRYMQQLTPVSNMQRFQFGDMNAVLNETISGIEVVKSASQENQERTRFMATARKFRDYFVEQGRIQARYLPLLFISIAFAAAFAHGMWLLYQNVISVGDLVAYMGLMGILRFPTFISIFTFSLVQMGLAGARRILELMDAETEMDENAGGYHAPMRGELRFDHVSFSHAGAPLADDANAEAASLDTAVPTKGPKVLDSVSFSVNPGETVAIVGQTGSGKSTLTKLVNRIYDVDAGRITIDGVDVREWNMAALRSQISTIEQDIFLFSRTIAGNIAFGLGPSATQEAIEAAAKDAQAHEFIMSFRDGYETVIGERGVTLSGGQRQRLAIARALLTNPSILIIDDSTSAIDSATEDRIQTAINRVLEGRTTLIITHRLSQIRRADKIIVLEKGQIVDQGTHEELLARSPLYQRVFARY